MKIFGIEAGHNASVGLLECCSVAAPSSKTVRGEGEIVRRDNGVTSSQRYWSTRPSPWYVLPQDGESREAAHSDSGL